MWGGWKGEAYRPVFKVNHLQRLDQLGRFLLD
jgi:hypothetical protein